MTKVRSALGEVVDFDLLAIKAQLAATPATNKVAQRQDFVADRESFRKVHTIELDDTNAVTIVPRKKESK